ncbi:MAG TPA: hypothetical protein VIA10_10515 [Gaiellaceae bacterium]|jgi:hypothetical protein
MAGKADFTEQEWDQLRKGATGAGLLVSVSDRGFFDSFKEATSLAKHMAAGRKEDSRLVRELAAERGTGFGVRSSPAEIESEALEALRGAVATLRAKAPDEVDAYRAFVLELAEAVGRAAGGGDEAEAATVEKIRGALA